MRVCVCACGCVCACVRYTWFAVHRVCVCVCVVCVCVRVCVQSANLSVDSRVITLERDCGENEVWWKLRVGENSPESGL